MKLEPHIAITKAENWVQNGCQYRDQIEEFRFSIEAHEGVEEAAQIIEMLLDFLPSR